MSSITASSTLDVNALVTQIVAAEREPYSLRFNRAESVAKSKISAYGTLSSAFDSLKRAIDALKAPAAFGGRTATSSDEDVFTATATSAVSIGSYTLEVESLASAQKLISAAMDDEDALGAGQLTLEVGDETFTVDIEDGDDTLTGIRDAINAAALDAGAKVSASVINADGGQHLVLTATAAGSENTIRVTNTSSPANAGLDALVYDPGTLESLTEQDEATDAKVHIDGVLRTASTNTLTDLVPGLTLNLKSALSGEEKTLTVSADNSQTKTLMQNLVNAYNTALNALTSTTKYDVSTNTPSALTGDSAARSARNQLRSAMGQAMSTAADAGILSADLGIGSNVDGTLTFNASKLESLLISDPDAVKTALAGANGFTDMLGSVVSNFTGSDGLFRARTDALTSELKSISDQRATADRRLSLLEERLRKQYSALDAMLAQSQSTSNFLAQQLASLSNT